MNYIPTILGALIGVCLFFIPVWFYRRGLKDGLALNQGKSIEPIQNPVQIITEYKEQKQAKEEENKAKIEANKEIEGMHNILNYDPLAVKKAVTHE